jgi:ABC-2 type transport system permease protein
MTARFNGIAGWRPYEVTFFYGLNLFSYSLAGVFCFYSFYGLGQMIRTGEFDNVLVKPVNPFLFIAVRQFNYGYFSHLSLSALVIGLSMAKLGIAPSFVNLAVMLIILLSGALIYAAVFVATGAPAFWLVRSESLTSLFLWNMGTFVHYPLSAFQRPVQLVFTLVLPYGFVSFFPAQFFLERHDYIGFSPVIQYLSPLVGATAFALAYWFWRFGLSRYQSTGS